MLSSYRRIRPFLDSCMLIIGVMWAASCGCQDSTSGHYHYWIRTCGGNGDDLVYAITALTDGSCVMTGQSGSYDRAGTFALKIDRFGVIAWDGSFGSLAWLGRGQGGAGYGVVEDNHGGVVIATSADATATLLNIDSLGRCGWEHKYGPDLYAATSIAKTKDDGYIFTGSRIYSYSWHPGLAEGAFLTKIDADGNVIWSRSYESPVISGRVGGIIQTPDSGFVFAVEPGKIIKTDPTGQIEWKSYSYDEISSKGHPISCTKDGGYVVALTANGRLAILRLDRDGKRIWQREYTGTRGISVISQNDGGYLALGQGRYGLYADKDDDVVLVRADSLGEVVWERCFGGSDYEVAFCLVDLHESGYLVAGNTRSYDYDSLQTQVLAVRVGLDGDTEEVNWKSGVKDEKSPQRAALRHMELDE